ncbi:Transmembrane protein [Ceratobasidium theobromae]|uniref:Transmembrane protein n=1 Tax=Ceratobasidium theobromae TaxID=1582974 RepID=A0A5N5Q9X4_9AGAM|nr:Transmembrane protein [Ceratobasidium theobromae]
MHAFSRITGFLFFVLSLSVFVSALPAYSHDSYNNAPAPGSYGQPSKSDVVVGAIAKLDVDVRAAVAALVECKAVADVKGHVDVIVKHVHTCADALVGVGAKIDVEATVKTDITAKIAALIILIVKACVDVSVRLGLKAVVGIFAQLDVCIKLLLVSLAGCIEGSVGLVAKIVAASCVDLLAQLKFDLCLKVLALAKL